MTTRSGYEGTDQNIRTDITAEQCVKLLVPDACENEWLCDPQDSCWITWRDNFVFSAMCLATDQWFWTCDDMTAGLCYHFRDVTEGFYYPDAKAAKAAVVRFYERKIAGNGAPR